MAITPSLIPVVAVLVATEMDTTAATAVQGIF
jgi:hypothetical protein